MPERFGQEGYIRVGTGKYNHLSQENRHQIEALLYAGYNLNRNC